LKKHRIDASLGRRAGPAAARSPRSLP
jgi:hypothetical protein